MFRVTYYTTFGIICRQEQQCCPYARQRHLNCQLICAFPVHYDPLRQASETLSNYSCCSGFLEDVVLLSSLLHLYGISRETDRELKYDSDT